MLKQRIIDGKTYLGIELGSTRIKACLIDEDYKPIAEGTFEWVNKLENGYWTYSTEDIHKGVKECYSSLRNDVMEKYGVNLTRFASIGVSAMMHGYMSFDKAAHLLVPFRTWRNTTTEQAAAELSSLFNFNIPQRWSIAHLYQAILNGEPHITDIAHITTLSGYVYYILTGNWDIGVCDASGMFPICGQDYDKDCIEKFDTLVRKYNFGWSVKDILPRVKLCGELGSFLSEDGAKFLDESGNLKSGIPICPPEGDAGTGMVATNSVKKETGNVSAGTSVFSMLVLKDNINGMYPEIDIVTTPDALPVAMIHSNNGCSELDIWVKVFGEFAEMLGYNADKSMLYDLLYKNALTGDDDCGGVVSYNFLADEPVAGVKNAKPSYFREQNSNLTLANFFKSQLYSTVAVLKFGMKILVEKENAKAKNFNAHGGLFKVKGVAQKFLASALDTPVSAFETSGEGGAWGMALLAAYMTEKGDLSLGDWLDKRVFGEIEREVIIPDKKDVDAFNEYFKLYEYGLLNKMNY